METTSQEEGQLQKSIWADYDPRRVRLVLQQSAGALLGVDTVLLVEDIRASRRQAARGRSPRSRRQASNTP